MKLQPLEIGNLKAKVPIIQGGMGVGISRSGLASAVASSGGIGIISSVQIGFDESDFEVNTNEANIRALKKHILRSKELSPKGIMGVNIMVATSNYNEAVKTAAESGTDIIVSGAGLPVDLPGIVGKAKTKIAPIVSSGKAAKIICKMWDRKYKRIPDLVVIEGPEAGGHLGYSLEDLKNLEDINLKDIIKDVMTELKPYEVKYNTKIPIVCGGGIYTAADVVSYMKTGINGVQMATRFIATEECDADIRYKEFFINSNKEDIKIVMSPVGMPGRAFNNAFVRRVSEHKESISKCYNCLKPCNFKDTPYCISKALINAVKGDVDNGLIFTGSNGYRIKEIVKVKDIIDEIVEGYEKIS